LSIFESHCERKLVAFPLTCHFIALRRERVREGERKSKGERGEAEEERESQADSH